MRMVCRGAGIALCLVLLYGMFTTRPYVPDYSFPYYYRHMQEAGRIPSGTVQCTLPEVEASGKSVEIQVNLTCAENHKAATINQIVVWLSYMDWLNCCKYHSQWACQEQGN